MITKSGHPYWVRSTPKRTTPSANRPTTTSTMPSAALEPPPRGRTGGGVSHTGRRGGAATGSGARTGVSSNGAASRLSAGLSTASDGCSATTGSVTTSADAGGADGYGHLGGRVGRGL